jgi:hypothetical protein
MPPSDVRVVPEKHGPPYRSRRLGRQQTFDASILIRGPLFQPNATVKEQARERLKAQGEALASQVS